MIDIAADFTRFPAGRYRSDGPFSGERFREDLLVPAMAGGRPVVIKLDGAMGFGSSFLEEAFGGLVRAGYFSAEDALRLITIDTRDQSLIDEIHEYITATRH